MNAKAKSENRWLMQLNKRAVAGAVTALLLLPLAVQGGGVVTECTESSLRAAMAGGGKVTFACDGTITLAKTITNTIDTLLDASGHQVTISGSNAVRVFYVNTNVVFALANLTVANGRAASGAGIFNAGGTVNLTNCTFSGNSARGAAGTDTGMNGGPGQDGCGGALDNFGVVNVIDCSFTGNSATGGGGGAGDSVFIPGDRPGYGGNGGIGFGGAVRNSGLLTASGCTFSGNSATGGIGGAGGSFLNMSTSPINGGGGGSGGSGNGGALYNSGIVHLVNCTLGFNTGAGAAGGPGGSGSRPMSPDYPPGAPGANGATGLGFGGICDASGQCHLTNCTLARNSCTGASYGPGSHSAGGIKASGATMVNTLLVENNPGGNCLGTITDLGHNLSSDVSCAFTHAGSLNGAYVLLGPLANNGGLTATMALLPGNLAIDGGDSAAAPSTDQRGIPRPFGNAADIGAYEYNSGTNPPPSQVVSSCTEASLRAAMALGGTVTFSCDGTIPLAGTIIIPVNTVLDATGHQITISGNNSVRVFHVNTNVSFTAINLTIANGRSGEGAGIFNDGGVLTLLRLNLRSNAVSQVLGLLPQGGAILNRGGSVNATNCTFTRNSVLHTNNSDSSPSAARGGAIRNESGEVNLQGCIFTANQASGAAGANGGTEQAGAPGGSGWGGAVDNSGAVRAGFCSFISNSVVGAKGGNGGSAFGPNDGGSGGTGAGGAIYSIGALTISRSTFSGNSASGGTGGFGVAGALAEPGRPGGGGGAGGSGNGGAIFNAGTAQLVNNTFVFNSGAGANGASGGNGGQARMGFQGGNGGNGGGGGSGFGAICDTSVSCWITNCTLALNSGTNGTGGAGGYGGSGSIPGSPGLSGSPGTAGGGIRTSGATLVNTLLATNAPGSNCFGRITDAGHNLSSDASCAFTNLGSLNNTDPKLGLLGDNGGPTLTMALLPDSPAIDGGDDVSAPSTDQRGLPRPVGAASDIGAYEYAARLRISRALGNGLDIHLHDGLPGQTCWLLTSTTLSNWQCVATNQIGPDGTVLFQDNCGTSETQRFYKVALP